MYKKISKSKEVTQLLNAPDYMKIKTLEKSMNRELLDAFANYPNSGIREIIAINEYTPLKGSLILAKDTDHYVRMGLAKNTKLPQIMGILAKDRDIRVVEQLIKNVSLTPEALDILADYDSTEIKNNVALHRNTTPEALDKLSKEKDIHIVTNIAKNKNTPEITLHYLLNYYKKEKDVLWGIASNPKASPETLSNIFNLYPKDLTIALAVSNNNNTEETTLNNILLNFKNNSGVLSRIALNRNTTGEMLDKIVDLSNNNLELLRLVIINKNLTPEAMEKMSLNNELWLMKDIAKKRGLTYQTYINLLKYNAPDVNLNLAVNPETPPDIIDRLMKSNNNELLKLLSERDNAPVKAIEKFKKLNERKINKKLQKTKTIPQLNYKEKSTQPITQKTNTDLELLQRLHSFLKN